MVLHGHHFDELTRGLSSGLSRRKLLRVVGWALGPLAATLGVRPVEASHHGCRHVGARCKRSRQCCSGQCKNKKCQAHHAGTCTSGPVGSPVCTVIGAEPCGADCQCYNTTGLAGYCALGGGAGGATCKPCTKDKECENLMQVAGAACVECPRCTDNGSPGGTACVLPCPTVAP